MTPHAPKPRKPPTALPAFAPRVRSVHSAGGSASHPSQSEKAWLRPRRRSLAAATATSTAIATRAITARTTLAATFATLTASRRAFSSRCIRRAFRLRQQRLHRETQAATLVAIDKLHRHRLALLHDV